MSGLMGLWGLRVVYYGNLDLIVFGFSVVIGFRHSIKIVWSTLTGVQNSDQGVALSLQVGFLQFSSHNFVLNGPDKSAIDQNMQNCYEEVDSVDLSA